MPLDENHGYQARDFKQVGSRPLRPDGVDKVTGRARFGADATAPGMLIAKVLRSPHAHARIRGFDTSKAEALEGVKAVVTRDDFPDVDPDAIMTGEEDDELRWVATNFMARDKALSPRHTVAAVASTNARIPTQALGRTHVAH